MRAITVGRGAAGFDACRSLSASSAFVGGEDTTEFTKNPPAMLAPDQPATDARELAADIDGGTLDQRKSVSSPSGSRRTFALPFAKPAGPPCPRPALRRNSSEGLLRVILD